MSDRMLDLPHDAQFDVKAQEIYIDVNSVILRLTIEDFFVFSKKIDDIQTVLQIYSEISEGTCSNCGTTIQEIEFKGCQLDDEDMN